MHWSKNMVGKCAHQFHETSTTWSPVNPLEAKKKKPSHSVSQSWIGRDCKNSWLKWNLQIIYWNTFMSFEDQSAGIALGQLKICEDSINRLKDVVREMYDWVLVGNDSPNREMDTIEAWNSWSTEVSIQRKYVAYNLNWSELFTNSPAYEDLSFLQKVDYSDRIYDLRKNIEAIDTLILFYSRLTLIEYSEQSIRFHVKNVTRNEWVLIRLTDSEKLVKRGLRTHKKTLQACRKRLWYEILQILDLLQEVIQHPWFKEIPGDMQQAYREKKQSYLYHLAEISREIQV